MKHFYFIIAIILFSGSIFSVNAQDLLVLRDGNVIEARVTEISATEIRYRRFSHLNGPVIVIARTDVLSIRYENKTVEIINPAPGAGNAQAAQSDTPAFLQSGEATLLQQALNRMPAIPIAGNNLKFEFRGDTWISRVNGENFSAGTIEYKETSEGIILTLKQTHIWPGAVGKTAGKIANVIPGGSAAGGALGTAGNIAGAAGPVEMPGTVITLEYKAGPPPALKLLSVSQDKTAKKSAADDQSEKSANVKNNWMSLEAAVLGFGIRYERMLNSNISLGLNAYFNPPSFNWEYLDYFEISTFFRVYPWGKTFFLGVGIGYVSRNAWREYEEYRERYDGYYYYDYYHGYERVGNISFIPEIGWKIDVGSPGGFYIMPCITFSLVDGEDRWDFVGGKRVFYFGMGIAF